MPPHWSASLGSFKYQCLCNLGPRAVRCFSPSRMARRPRSCGTATLAATWPSATAKQTQWPRVRIPPQQPHYSFGKFSNAQRSNGYTLEVVLNLKFLRSFKAAFVLVAVLCFALVVSVQGQVNAPDPIKPGSVTMQLRTINGKSQFHRGEIIPVELVFSSPERRSYTIPEDCTPMETYQYSISPQAVDRALEADAAMSMYMGNCHGFSAQADPGEEPITVRQILNERFRIETPGTYNVSVRSNKLGFPLMSNALQIEIQPSDAVWEQSQFDRAKSLLSSQYGSESWAEGCGVLRYLETPQAELEMARREGKQQRPCDFDIPLISARNRQMVLDQLEKGLGEPDRAIPGNYLRVLAFVSLYQQHPDWYPVLPAKLERFSEFVPSERSGLWSQRGVPQAEQFRYASLLAAALNKKTPEARSQSLKTLLYLGDSLSGSEVPADLLAVVRREIPAAFADLPPIDRDAVLFHQWDEIKSPAMLSVLRDLVVESHWLGGNGIALIRLNELSPTAARPVILEELRSPNPQGSVAALSLLPEKQLPDLDAIFLHQLMDQQNDGATAFPAGLLRRYASSAIALELKSWFTKRIGKSYCGTEAELIAYFLSVAPADGVAMLHAAMKSDNSGCLLLRRLADIAYSPEVEKEAIAALDDSRLDVSQEALQVLRENGSPSGREALLQHFRKWHDRWSGHAKELTAPTSINEARLEYAYSYAIGFARNWLSTADDWRELQKLCLTAECKDRAQQIILNFGSQFEPMIVLSPLVGDELQESFGLGGCQRCTLEQLHDKMLQYPASTRFLVDARFARQTRIQRVFSELQPWVSAHGFALQLYRD